MLKKGNMPTLPISYNSNNTIKLIGGKLKSFKKAVVDVAAQYLE